MMSPDAAAAAPAWRAGWQRYLAARPSYRVAAFLFLRGVALVYAMAFLSLAVQVQGLLGSGGVLPVEPFLRDVQAQLGARGFWAFPTLCWLNASDGFLTFLCVGGAALSLLLLAGWLPPVSALGAWLFYLSLTTAGRTFLGFQWDNLLLETGLLAVFLAPWTWRSRLTRDPDPPRLMLFLVNWLLFRFMISSGVVKLASGDPSWRHLTALTYHYGTTCLPNPLAWYADKLPLWFHKASCFIMFFIELAVPWLMLGPRRARYAACAAFVALQAVIVATGNYGFFNLLSVVLCLPLLDDRAFPAWVRRRLDADPARRGRNWPRWVQAPVAMVVLLVSLMIFTGALRRPVPWPRWVRALYESVQPARSINGYGLFASMTKTRPEIILEGSMDGQNWSAYEFKYKPGDLKRAPPFVAPHQPRLDWQMWFAALGDYQGNPWLVNLMIRLLQGSEPVRRLMAYDPFPDEPPLYLRAVTYEYRYTSRAERAATGQWWKREFRGLYCPPIRIKNPE